MDKKKKEKEEIDELFEQLKDGEQDEEELSKFFQQLEKKISKGKNNTRIAYMFGLLTSPNLFLHLLFTLVLNFAIMGAIQGFFGLIHFNSLGTFALAILVFTAVEFVVKALCVRYLLKLVLACAGIVFLALIIVYFALLNMYLPNFYFESLSKLIIFVLSFWTIRYIITRLAIAYITNRLNKKYMRKEQ